MECVGGNREGGLFIALLDVVGTVMTMVIQGQLQKLAEEETRSYSVG